MRKLDEKARGEDSRRRLEEEEEWGFGVEKRIWGRKEATRLLGGLCVLMGFDGFLEVLGATAAGCDHAAHAEECECSGCWDECDGEVAEESGGHYVVVEACVIGCVDECVEDENVAAGEGDIHCCASAHWSGAVWAVDIDEDGCHQATDGDDATEACINIKVCNGNGVCEGSCWSCGGGGFDEAVGDCHDGFIDAVFVEVKVH